VTSPRSFSFLVNPLSGGGAAPGAVVPVARLLRDAGATVEVTYSPGPLATLDLVRAAVDRRDVVVAVGGDGMLSSVAGEVAALGGTLGIVPAGRGNDFARMLGLPDDPAEVARVLLSGTPTAVDLVELGLPDGSTRVVAGSAHAGVDAHAAELVDRAHWLPRRLQYPYAAVRALATFTPASYALVLDGTPLDVRAATVVVANSGCYGSGMRIAPDASVTDGVLDVVVIGAAGRLDLIRSLPKVYDGSHVRLPDVQVHCARHIEISVTADATSTAGSWSSWSGRSGRIGHSARSAGVPVGADGEPLPALVPGTTLTATVLPGALSHLT
jgi:YegS/Rv2252/BmrU family lipid kinase